MGFKHIALVNQNLPHIVKGGPIARLDRDILIVIAGHLPVSSTTFEWFIPMAELKHELGLKPETWNQNVKRSIAKMVGQGWLEVRNGCGRKANTYILTANLMEGNIAPERKESVVTENGGTRQRKAKEEIQAPTSPYYCHHINFPQEGELVDHPHQDDKPACDAYKTLHPPDKLGIIR